MSDFIDYSGVIDKIERLKGHFSVSSDHFLRAGWIVGGVSVLGFAEAVMLCKRPVPLRFALRYAVQNILPSMVWRTSSLDVIRSVTRVSCDKMAALSPRSQLHVESLQSLRYILATYGLISHLISSESHEDRSSSVPLPTEERIVRLSSSESPVTATSIAKHGAAHIYPLSSPLTLASFNLAQDANVHEEWNLKTKSGKRVLLLEVDLTSSSATDAPSVLASIEALKRWISVNRQDDISVLTVAIANAEAIDTCSKSPSIDVLLNADIIYANKIVSKHPKAKYAVQEAGRQNQLRFNLLKQSLLHQGVRTVDGCSQLPHVISADDHSSAYRAAEKLEKGGLPKDSICLLVDSAPGAVGNYRTIVRSDVIDAEFQRIRHCVRDDMDVQSIIAKNLSTYGSPRAVTTGGYRSDMYSRFIF